LLRFFANSVAGLVRPSWKVISIIARMARRPHANKAFNSEVIRPMLMSCVKITPVHSMRPPANLPRGSCAAALEEHPAGCPWTVTVAVAAVNEVAVVAVVVVVTLREESLCGPCGVP